jgi:hypothetical protein
MTDPLTKIDQLAKASRGEEAPSPDVSGRVLASIRERAPMSGYAPLQWITAGSAVAAIAMSVSILSLYETWSDPLNALLLDVFGGLL